MREVALKAFFEGTCSAEELRADLDGALVPRGPDVTAVSIEDMHVDFELTTEHLVRLCDAVMAGTLAPESLEPIGFCLVASDAFHWDADTPDGARVAEVVHDWSAPEVNYPLVRENVAEWRKVLRGEEGAFRGA